MANRKIATILSLKDKMSQPLFKVNKNVGKITKEMRKSQSQIERWKRKGIKSIDSMIKKTGKFALATAGAFGALAVGTGFKGMMELDESSAKVKSIAGNALELNKIQDELLKNSTKTGIAFNELADAQYSAISSGVKASESMDAAVLASKLGVAGFTDTNSALKLMTSTMNVYGMTGSEAMQEVSDKMLVTQNLGVTSVDELANSLGSVTPIAKAAGISLDDILGSVGALTKGGQGTSEAMTGLKGMISNIIKPTKQASEMAKQLGIDFSTTVLKNKGFPAFLEEIKEKTGGNTDQMAQLFGSVQGLNAVLSLTSEEGFKDFNNILGEVKDSAGATDEAYKTMTDTIGFKLNTLKNTAKNIFTSMMNSQAGVIGEYIDKVESWVKSNESTIQGWVTSIGEGVSKMIEFVRSVFNFIAEHEKAITTILVFITTLYAVIKVIGLVITVMNTWKTISMLLNGALKMTSLTWIVLAIAAVIAIGYALYRNWDLIKAKASELNQSIRGHWQSLKQKTSEAWKSIQKSVETPIKKIKEAWEGLRNFMKNPIKGTVNAVKSGAGWIKDKVTGGGKKQPAFAKGTSYSPAGYARIHEEGGEIRKLSSGETIIPADKSDRLLKNKSMDSGVKIDVIIQGNVIGNKKFADEVGSTVYKKVKIALDNM